MYQMPPTECFTAVKFSIQTFHDAILPGLGCKKKHILNNVETKEYWMTGFAVKIKNVKIPTF
jgi:hypothetical protein